MRTNITFLLAFATACVLAVQVTPGWWADKVNSPSRGDGMIGHKCAFRGVLELRYADGSTRRYGTNLRDWKAGIAGPVKHAAILDGEEYDARELPGYATPEKLSTPEENTEFPGRIFPSEGAEVYLRRDIALAPVQAYVWQGVEGASEGEYGKVVVLRNYTDGQQMVIRPGETAAREYPAGSYSVSGK